MAIITKNEETRLPDCLRSASFADDIVVLDSGSSDRTEEIARDFGCRVFVEEWKGYGPQKNSAVAKCRSEWVLVIDADERIPEETKNEIIKIVNHPESADAYSFPRKNFFHGKWIKHGGWWPDRTTRLFKKSKGKVEDSLVHESVKVSGIVKNLHTPILHHSIKDLTSVIEKINAYSSLGAKSLLQEGKQSSALKASSRGAAAFLKSYLLEAGFLDGYEGFVIAFSHAVNTCYKYLKLKELTVK